MNHNKTYKQKSEFFDPLLKLTFKIKLYDITFFSSLAVNKFKISFIWNQSRFWGSYLVILIYLKYPNKTEKKDNIIDIKNIKEIL